jgi:hypothetical protein
MVFGEFMKKSGWLMADVEEKMSICEACEKYSRRWGKCSECGCFVAVKIHIPFSKCPLGKW